MLYGLATVTSTPVPNIDSQAFMVAMVGLGVFISPAILICIVKCLHDCGYFVDIRHVQRSIQPEDVVVHVSPIHPSATASPPQDIY
jgi:hypothetical protein